MKRMICLILVSCLFLSGCGAFGEWIKEPVTFYYIREDYQKNMEQVIVSEVREASGHRDDLSYLLALYSMGPAEEELTSPLPGNTRIMPIERTADTIVLSLSENVERISDVDFTLASACLALTCMDLTNATQITVACGERKITVREDNLLQISNSILTQQEETK